MKAKQIFKNFFTDSLILLVILQLIIFPVKDAIACDYTSPGVIAAKTTCLEDKTKEWSDSKCMCITSAKTEELRDLQAQWEAECAEDDDPAQCRHDKAVANSGDLQERGMGGTAASGVMMTISMMLATMSLTAGGKKMKGDAKKPKKCLSSRTMQLAAVAHLAAEIATWLTAQKKLKDLYKSYEEIEDQSPFQAQIAAFQYLKKEQETLQKIAEAKAKSYYALIAIYAVAIAVSIYEIAKHPMGKACSAVGEVKMGHYVPIKGPLQIEKTNFMTTILNQIMSSAIAEDVEGIAKIQKEKEEKLVKQSKSFWAMIGIAGAAAGTAALVSHFWRTKFSVFMSSSYGIIIIAGLGIIWSSALAAHSNLIARRAKRNAKRIQAIIDQLETGMEGFCPNGREDLAEPTCYCYLASGLKNSGRTNSATCQTLWTQEDLNYFVEATNNMDAGVGCVRLDGQFDPNCECRRYIDQNTKLNACYKDIGFNAATQKIPGVGTQMSLGSLANTATSMASGNYSSAMLTGNTATNAAMRNKKIANGMLSQANKKLKTKGINTIPIVDKKFADGFMKKMLTPEIKEKLRRIGSIGNLNQLAGKNAKGKKAATLRKVMKKTGLDKILYKKVGKRKSKKKDDENSDDFNFSFDNKQAGAGNEPTIQEFMKKKYNYKENDIVKDQDVPIWKILSKRYNQSGLRRLFEDKVKK